MQNVTSPLRALSEHCTNQKGKKKIGVFFDIDSTLFCVAPRTQEILRALGRESDFSKRYTEVSSVLREVDVLPSEWGIRHTLARLGVNGPSEMFQTIRSFWGQNFFSNYFLRYDRMYARASQYVQHLQSLGAEIHYLTGRPRELMLDGTVEVLAHHQFPAVGDQDRLMMKPSTHESDEGFKAERLRKISGQFDELWLFENEPVIIDQVEKSLPATNIIFVNTVHAGRSPSPTHLPTIVGNYEMDLSSL